MTNEEAIDILRKKYRTVSQCLTVNECRENNEAIRLAISALSRDRWISVEERLPEMHEEVLICTEDYGESELGFAMVAVWDGSDWIDTWDRRGTIHCVTHWRPLPEPPKEET